MAVGEVGVMCTVPVKGTKTNRMIDIMHRQKHEEEYVVGNGSLFSSTGTHCGEYHSRSQHPS